MPYTCPEYLFNVSYKDSYKISPEFTVATPERHNFEHIFTFAYLDDYL